MAGEDCSNPSTISDATPVGNGYLWSIGIGNYFTADHSFSCDSATGVDGVIVWNATTTGLLAIDALWHTTDDELVLEVMEGTCNGGTTVLCLDSNDNSPNDQIHQNINITSGNTYYIWMANYTSGDPFHGVDITLEEVVPSTGETCALADTGFTGATYTFTPNSTLQTQADICYADDMYWLTYNYTGGTSSLIGFTSSVATGMAAYTGACGGLTELSCAVNSQQFVFELGSTTPQTIYLAVQAGSSPITLGYYTPTVCGEDCSTPCTLVPGTAQYIHGATVLDYWITNPSCQSFGDTANQDVVFEYIPSASFSNVNIHVYNLPTSNRYNLVVNDSACGSTTELACDSDWTGSSLNINFAATLGTTYYVYIMDTDSGSALLPDPLDITVTETP